ncbi:TSUP family transporter [Dyadobacter sp. CY312]|uniref:sulfite exporter TauE/SafE family protein n=1 Tax=Dyadobacter sp. CY312 TaxID=2907303 RepID=UPI001F20705C|nr:TSUP family transporter [Dyadobacter sp. CY312]MCE7040089.1 TSUP family transporter [Dyadobacter sp. CY312]
MDFSSFSTDYPLILLLSLSTLAFIAGFIDAVVGGGGLIQIPALLIAFPDKAVATLFGTNKIAAISGTSVAAYQYSKRIKFDYRLLIAVSVTAFVASFLGAKAVSMVRADILRPIILVILIFMLVYVYTNKNLGAVQARILPFARQLLLGSLIGLVVGFYDGFFGPGTGSFLILGFVVLLRFDFLTASGYAKLINCVTNISALSVFIRHGNFLLGIGLMMAAFNIAGNIIGSRMALRQGNGFVRKIFLVVVSLMILRYGYDVFTGYYTF